MTVVPKISGDEVYQTLSRHSNWGCQNPVPGMAKTVRTWIT